jgi:hypothetical protein
MLNRAIIDAIKTTTKLLIRQTIFRWLKLLLANTTAAREHIRQINNKILADVKKEGKASRKVDSLDATDAFG